MSGHSKFANIKHKKEKNDAAKGKMFTIIGKEIAVAVKEGGADPDNNSKLRDVIAKAKANNMPNDTIDRGIKKAAGNAAAVNYETARYEGYGPNGVAVIVEASTDNKNRTAGNVRYYFDKNGGNLGTSGCVSFMFDNKGQILIEASDDVSEDELMEAALEAGAEDFITEEDGYEVVTAPEDFAAVRDELQAKGYEFISADVKLIPQTTTELTDETQLKMMNKLVDMLEDDDDVQNVYHNWEIAE